MERFHNVEISRLHGRHRAHQGQGIVIVAEGNPRTCFLELVKAGEVCDLLMAYRGRGGGGRGHCPPHKV